MKDPLKVDARREEGRIVEFIRKVVARTKAGGVVLGVSGGVDSAVTGALCVRALGKDRVVAALLPSEHTPKEDIDDAKSLARGWGVRALEINIAPFAEGLAASVGGEVDRIAKGNIQARVRMTLLYGIANSNKLLVAGTGDRSELLLGFFTKWGDGGVDFLPIAHLYKTQVRVLGAHLGIPVRVVNKPASPQLWPGHTAADELPAGYEKLDYVLHYLLDRGLSLRSAASKAGVDAEVARVAYLMNRKSSHKRRMPPSLLSGSQEIRFTSAKD